ncbi:putative nucleotidyltransferase substrate binding domain-containing protein [Streptomyces scabiei]|uniref:putative nucleotidyltransferase substrate binding domain-containing protein n=1 Tax=Streptomyces scabiei TaxID=1930 RepID=UPI002FF42719
MQEFTDFLGAQAPFDDLDAKDLAALARSIQVEYFSEGTMIVAEGAPALDHVYVVRSGAVEVLDRGRTVDLLGTGDTFGHISVLTGLSPALSVRAAEDTLCYRIPDPRTLVSQPERLRFAHFGTMISRQRLTRDGLLGQSRAPVSQFMRPVVWCSHSTPVRDVAVAISDADQSCALVRLHEGLGIITDQDFRRKVATGLLTTGAPARELATRPVVMVDARTPLATAFVQMVESGVHHLVVTDDNGRPAGVVRAIDLASVEVRDPLVIRSAIESATTIPELAEACSLIPATAVELHDNNVPAAHIGALLAAVTDAVLHRLLALTATDAFPVAGGTSWLVLGSSARREPLPGSDVDTGLMWDTLLLPTEDPPSSAAIRAQAAKVLDAMEVCGLRRCPDGANADNPLFSRSRASWTKAAQGWITHPSQEGALLLSSMVADSRPITAITLGRSVTDTIRRTTRSTEFLSALLRFTLATKPPTGFVRDFVVESSGEHRGGLDLKAGGLRPVTSLARWLAMVSGDVHGTTPDRLRRGAANGMLTDEEAETLIGAFTDIYELAIEREVAAIRGGGTASTWIAPKELDTLTRRHLRESFRVIASVQNRVDGEWKSRLR